MNLMYSTVIMEVYLLILHKILGRFDCTIKVLMHSCIPHKYRAAIIIFISIFKYYLQLSLIMAALIQHEKHHTSHAVGATPILCM